MRNIYDEVDDEARHDWLQWQEDWREANGYSSRPTAYELHYNSDCDGDTCEYCAGEEDY